MSGGPSRRARPRTHPTVAGGDVPGGDATRWCGSLERLATLHASGQLTDEEFARAKDAVLDAEREGAS